MARQSVLLLLVVTLGVLKTIEAAPIFDTVIGNFMREFFFSGGTFDQDDEPFSLDFDPSAENTKDNKGKKNQVIVLSKDEEEVDSDNLPRVRSMKPEESSKTKRAATPQLNPAQMQKLLNDLRLQLKDPKIQSRTIGEFLEGVDESFMNTIGVSAVSGLRAFFQQMMTSFFS